MNRGTQHWSESTSRVVLFVALTLCAIGLAGGYILLRQARSGEASKAVSSAPIARSLEVLGGRPGLLFSSAAFDRTNGYLSVQPLGGSDGTRYRMELRCERVHFAAGVGVCVTAERGVTTRYAAQVFGPDLRVRHALPLQGVPSRARVSPDGRRAAVTVFVSGDSYSAINFSTRTILIDTATGKAIADLETFAVTRDGVVFKAVDFNYWGVTFARDGDLFFATLRTGGVNYLIEGHVDARTARILRPGVECPSLSPDGTRLVFKSHVSPSQWRLHMLDLSTLKDVPLAETRSVDDQAEWLDDNSIAYMLPNNAGGGGSDIWVLTTGAQALPAVLVPNGLSPAALR